jgi:hypothetical protein
VGDGGRVEGVGLGERERDYINEITKDRKSARLCRYFNELVNERICSTSSPRLLPFAPRALSTSIPPYQELVHLFHLPPPPAAYQPAHPRPNLPAFTRLPVLPRCLSLSPTPRQPPAHAHPRCPAARFYDSLSRRSPSPDLHSLHPR